MFRKLNPICWSDIGKCSIIGGFWTCCLFIHRSLRQGSVAREASRRTADLCLFSSPPKPSLSLILTAQPPLLWPHCQWIIQVFLSEFLSFHLSHPPNFSRDSVGTHKHSLPEKQVDQQSR